MPRTRSLAWSELKIGVLTIIAIVITAVTIFMLMGGKGFFWQRYPLKTKFTHVAGLKDGSPVRIAGVEVGSVDGVEVTGPEVEIVFYVNKNKSALITSESMASLGSISLLGESAVDITPGTGAPLPENAYVKTGKPAVAIATVAVQASEGVEALKTLANDISAGKGTIGKLATDEALYAELQQFVGAANQMAQSVRQGKGAVGKLMNDPKTANSLEASLKNMEDITRRINAGEGSLGQLMNDPAFSDSLTKATTNLKVLTDKINAGQGTVGKLMNDEALYTKIDSVTGRLDELVNKLNAGEGTAGQLLKDKQLYENMNKTIAEMQGLLADIRRDPKKYLNVKVSIF